MQEEKVKAGTEKEGFTLKGRVHPEGLFSPYRVLDLTSELGALCGKILGDLGADVLKVERPRGDLSRSLGPFLNDVPHPEKSLFFFALNNNKRGITLNLETKTGQELFCQLIKRTDVLLESHPPGYLDGLGIGYENLQGVNPGLIMTSITPFGQTGPYSSYRAADIELLAMGGLLSLVGEPDDPPVRVSLPQSFMWTGMHAAMGTTIALAARGTTGLGQHVDVSAQASLLWAISIAPTFWDVLGENPRRAGAAITGRSVTGAALRAIFPCKDGYVNFVLYGGPAGIKTNKALTAWMVSHGMASERLRQKDWDKFDIATVTLEEVAELEQEWEKFFLTLTKAEFFQGCLERGMLGYPVATVEDIAADPQLEDRGFWNQVDHPELGQSIRYPGGFARFSEVPCQVRRRAPFIGEHNEEIYIGELGLARSDLAKLKEANII